MKDTKRLIGILGFALCGALVGDNASGAVSLSVGVEIRAQSDFYEPLTPYGEWVAIGSYGRCWRPSRMEAGWRPYCNGYWQRTDAGWYWASDEPWGWATYHYGRWGFSDEYGWYWVPQTEWAPAWVSWHRGGGYIGWEPLYMSGVRVSLPRAYVFVQERHFLDPVRPSTVVVNNTTIINQTVINEAPTTAVVEKASGRKVQALPVLQLRHKEEAAVAAKQRTPAPTSEKTVQAPVPSVAAPGQKQPVAARAPPRVEPVAATHPSAAPAPKISQAQPETRQSVPPAAESELAAKPKGNPPAAIKQPTRQNAKKQPVKQEESVQPSNQQVQPAGENPGASKNDEPNTADKSHGNKGKE